MANGKLEISLKSDLCVHSGYSYSGIIDSDCCYDECGIPYIPARRLRGCIRESLESLLLSVFNSGEIDNCFGRRGQEYGSDLVIGNAYILGYDRIKEDILSHKAVGEEYSTQEILSRFTHVISQTAMDNGVTDNSTLRFTRVVNRKSPITKTDMVFEAELSCSDAYIDMIEKGAKATRHIGLKRNRGFGNVLMSAKFDEKQEENQKQEEDLFITKTDAKSGHVQLFFAVKNVQPLMLSGTEEDSTRNYIPGQQVLGLLAGRYLKGQEADTEEFRNLFLNGKTVYSNLYPYDGDLRYHPAPDYLNQLKKSKKLVYTLGAKLPENDILDDDYKYNDGNQPKKLKGKFIAQGEDGKIRIKEVKKGIVYHHSHRNTHKTSNDKEEGILYPLEVVREGQMFAGCITGTEDAINIIKNLLLENDLYFGKSKSAQYGRCRLVKYQENIKQDNVEEDQAGKVAVITFESDTVFLNECGIPTVFYEEVRRCVSKKLGLEYVETEDFLSSIQTTLATGYISKWNLRKPAVPAIKAGSFLTFNCSGALPSVGMIGERNLEGYGEVSIKWADDLKYDSPVKCEIDNAEKEKNVELSEETKTLILPIIIDKWLERKINEAISNGDKKIKVSDTAAGRMTLMLKESVAEADNPSDAFKEFAERINSFKTEETKAEGRKLLASMGNPDDGILSEKFLKADDELEKALQRAGISDASIKEEKKKRWDRFAMAVLVDRKYKGR